MERAVETLKLLSEAFGPSGFEREVVHLVKKQIEGYVDGFMSDKLGSLVFFSRGSSERPRILLAGHVDEVGFIVSSIDKDTGYIAFNPLGGWFDQVLLSQRVVVRSRKGVYMGVIASKPPHLLTPEEANQVVKKENMYIDVGATSGREVEEMGIRIGDPIVPWSPFVLLRDNKVALGKAFDDRVGVAIAMESIRRLRESDEKHPNALYGAATVQEEVGLRGATTVPHLIEPDLALILEVDIAGDVPGIKPREAPTKMGKGPSIVTFDASMIPNQALKEFVIDVAESCKIPYQLSAIAKGGTDAGRIHIHKVGCPSIVISVPTRHIHSHTSVLSIEDLENAIKLTVETVKRLDQRAVDRFTEL